METPLEMTREEIGRITRDIKMAEKMRDSLNSRIKSLKEDRGRLRIREISLMTEDLEMQQRIEDALLVP